MDFAGKTIWIIGASAGIGAALAQALAAQGAKLILSARDRAILQDVAQDFDSARIEPVDLAQAGDLERVCERLRDITPLDAVICTAALYEPSRIADLDPDKAEAMVRVNILGTLEVARLCPPLLRDGGQLVLFGSVAGYVGLKGGQPYSATKAAVINIAESLAAELAPRVDVRLVCPGFVTTRLTAKNSFTMPAIATPTDAAKAVLLGMSRSSFEIHFPRRFTYMVKLLRALPYGLSRRLTARIG